MKNKPTPKRAKREINHVLMTSKFEGKCAHCKGLVSIGAKVWWSSQTKKVIHFGCFETYKGYYK